jgi:hypothetical protein
MHDNDLKQMIRDDPTPGLSAHFADRALQRLQPQQTARGRVWQRNWAGLGGALGRRPASAWRPWVWMLAAVALAWWAQTHVLQPPEDDLYKIDAIGLSSLLTL